MLNRIRAWITAVIIDDDPDDTLGPLDVLCRTAQNRNRR